MFIVYYVSITTVGGFLTDWTNDTLFGEWIVPGARTLLENIHCAGWLTGLVVDGIISGVGAVLGFVPQMLVLFIFLAFLESLPFPQHKFVPEVFVCVPKGPVSRRALT